MSRLCTILARGGSKGLPGKNIRPLAGRPLIAHAIDQARRSGCFDVVAVSSDSAEILEVAGRFGADELVERPTAMADDHAPKVPAIRHCVEEVERRRGMRFDVVVDLAVTSPLRSPEDIRGAVAMLESTDAPNVLSGHVAASSPYYTIVELDDGRVRLSKKTDKPLYRRQDAPVCYDLNGAVYAWRRSVLDADSPAVLLPETRLFVMPAERAVDIDGPLDFAFVEFLLARGETP